MIFSELTGSNRPQTTTGAIIDQNAKAKELQELRFSIGKRNLKVSVKNLFSRFAAILPRSISKSQTSAQKAKTSSKTTSTSYCSYFSLATDFSPKIANEHVALFCSIKKSTVANFSLFIVDFGEARIWAEANSEREYKTSSKTSTRNPRSRSILKGCCTSSG